MNEDNFSRAVDFVRSLGIPVTYRLLQEETFLPGLLIENGGIVVDLSRLKYPGDILHEAGHIAAVPQSDRATLTADTIGKRPDFAAEEMMAIAWSYAACKHLSLDPYFVFHDEGYQDSGRRIADEFEAGHYFGVPMLQWVGMSAEPHQAQNLRLPAFPAMAKWLRDN